MSEAENKWREWDSENWDISMPTSAISMNSREAYKAALKREIEKRNKDNDYLYQWTTSEIIELLDTIEP